ncbi:MAG: ABC transporter ATP-binding protein [Lachnospiraceae bacterium]|nr:ABC transporter ATP-binding protein [Lachnospiraceae bacterium]
MIFSVENGHFGYGERKILQNISFSVKDSEVLTILGPNGVGKTTLLKCMMGLLPWNQGQTLLDGRSLNSMKPTEVWKRIAYVPQSKATALSYTAFEMVLMGRSARLGLFAQPTKKDYHIAEEAMEQVGITHLAHKHCSRISGGELQMVLIARALSTHPKMLVMDEPESNLDFKNQLIVLETIQRLSKEQGIASIVNTHYPAHALKIADKALLLDYHGGCRFGNVEEIVSEENMRKAFNVEVKILDYVHQNQAYKGVIPLSILPDISSYALPQTTVSHSA